MEIIIEEITRGQKLIARHKFAKENVAIGRGYHNDIIITDPHVCADHLSLSFDGEDWIMQDEDSINGSFIENDKESLERHIVKSGQVFSLGKSSIRVIFPNHPVPESITFSPFENLINLTRHPAVLFFSIVLFGCVTGWLFNLHNPTEVKFTQLLVPAIGMTILFSLWPASVALVSHLTKHEARFWGQLGICFVFFNLMLASDFIENIVSFNSSGNSLSSNLIILIPIALSFGLFWMNCHVGFHMSTIRRNVVAACLTTLVFGGSYLIQLSKTPEFSVRPQFNNTLMTPSFLLRESSDVQEFVEDSKSLFEKAQKAIKEED